MHPKRVKLGPTTSQTTLRLSAKRHRTLPLSPSPLHSPSLRHTDPIPRCTGLPYPPSLGIRNSSGHLAILDRGVKVSNGRWGNGCSCATVAETVRVLGLVSNVGNEAVFSTPLYLLVGNDFYSKIIGKFVETIYTSIIERFQETSWIRSLDKN